MGETLTIPKGWALVPIEPTEAMIEAGLWHNHRHNGEDNMVASYREMVMQASIDGPPLAPPEPEGGEDHG